MSANGERHVVIGTAGHVDHGKTALVKAITGVDTDRWKEEKQRGITIDLGFAPLTLADGRTASVVDVPGHEDFVRNMVAGATGVDVALLVVAADEGMMPQTYEHLSILEFLGVRSGVVAITKADLVEPEWLELVADDVAERLATSPIEWQTAIPVSVISGAGLEDLLGAIQQATARSGPRATDDLFRMPVDRVFSVAGAGTVVTGTVWAGEAKVGTTVQVLPAGRDVRVRSIEVHGHAADRAVPGRRTALALVGIDRQDAPRGSMVVVGSGWQPSRRVDVRVHLLPGARPLTQRSRVRFHIGTAEVMARVTPVADAVQPGEHGVIRLRLETPLVCRWGDRGVLRSYSPVTTVGGCVVVDPFPDPRPRRPSADSRLLDPDPTVRIPAFVEARGRRGVDEGELEVRIGVPPGRADTIMLALPGIVRSGTTLISEKVAQDAAQRLLRAVSDFHGAFPLEPGLPLEAFRKIVENQSLAEFGRSELERRGAIVVHQGYVRLAGHQPTLDGEDARYGAVLLEALEEAGGQGATVAELSDRIPAGRAQAIAEFYVRQDTVVRIGEDRYLHRNIMDALTSRVVAHLREVGEASPADFRTTLGLTRKYLIPVLSWLDAQGVTVRAGDVRRLGPKAHQVDSPGGEPS